MAIRADWAMMRITSNGAVRASERTVSDDTSLMQSAQLQVVQPGSRASFRRRVIDAMRSMVNASGAFFCFGTQDARAYGDSTRLVDGQPSPIRKSEGVR